MHVGQPAEDSTGIPDPKRADRPGMRKQQDEEDGNGEQAQKSCHEDLSRRSGTSLKQANVKHAKREATKREGSWPTRRPVAPARQVIAKQVRDGTSRSRFRFGWQGVSRVSGFFQRDTFAELFKELANSSATVFPGNLTRSPAQGRIRSDRPE